MKSKKLEKCSLFTIKMPHFFSIDPLRPIAATYLTKLFNSITINNSPAARAREVFKPSTAVVPNRGFPDPKGSETRFWRSEMRFSKVRVCMFLEARPKIYERMQMLLLRKDYSA